MVEILEKGNKQMNKLIKFIKKLHWKIYGKERLLNRLYEDMRRCTMAWCTTGMRKNSPLDRKLTDLLNAINDVESW